MEVTRVFDILNRCSERPKPDLLSSKVNKEWKPVSTKEFLSHIDELSVSLLNMGLNPGDKVSIIAINSPQWNMVDFAAQKAGIITVPIFPTASAHDMEFILRDSGAKMVFFSSVEIEKKIKHLPLLPDLKHIVSLGTEKGDYLLFEDLLKQGRELISSNGKFWLDKVETICAQITKDDVFTVLYTSGTTGTPKGVMLCHENIISNVIACLTFAPFDQFNRALSFLPLNHVYERMLSNLYLYTNISIYYAESMEKIADNLKEIKPQMFVTVPRLLERVFDKLVAAGEKLTGFKKKIFFWALDLALEYEMYGAKGAWYEFKRKIADKLVYSKWRAALGGEVYCVASGGAALQPRLARVFNCANIMILEGYGLTETSPVIAVNSLEPDSIRIGTVGKVLKNLEVKIADDGEILVKGPSIMKGYYKNPEATKEVLEDDGWFHTGDIGTFIEGKFLKITDRKKEIFKTSAGKYIAPLMIENMLKESKFIEQCMVIGEGQKFASAIIVPAFDAVKEWCKQKGIEYVSNESIITNDELKKEINTFIRSVNKQLAPYEQLKRVELTFKFWTIESGEMTPKLSMKRKVIKENNKALIDKIFASAED